jgi:hypothetical protein
MRINDTQMKILTIGYAASEAELRGDGTFTEDQLARAMSGWFGGTSREADEAICALLVKNPQASRAFLRRVGLLGDEP